MKRSASAHLEFDVTDAAEFVLSVAAAAGYGVGDATSIDETLTVTQGGRPVSVREVADHHGTRLHVCDVDAGRVIVDYRVDVTGRLEAPGVETIDLVRYRRPSRYCESDTLGPTARAEFSRARRAGPAGRGRSWVGSQLRLRARRQSAPTDGAVQTLLDRQGVCRDYAHLVIALLRALDVPARLVSVYAPGLSPMDFHAVAEAFVDGRWQVVDATRWPRGRRCCASRRGAMLPTPRSSRAVGAGSRSPTCRSGPWPTSCRSTTRASSCRSRDVT